jgi:uncharacterized protein (DUF697 family)
MSWLDTLEGFNSKDFTQATPQERNQASRDVINLASYACAVVAISPVPFSDALLHVPLQTAMVGAVAHIYGHRVTKTDAKRLIAELGTTVGLSYLTRQGLKAFLPIYGALLTLPTAFAATWAMGRVAVEYFKHGGLSAEELKAVYKKAQDQGRAVFSREKMDAFRKKEAAPARRKPAKRRAATPTVDALLRKRVRAAKEGEPIGGCVHLALEGKGGGEWTLDLSGAKPMLAKGLAGSPRLVVRGEAAALVEVMNGGLSAAEAVTGGRLSLEPMDLELARKVGELLQTS